MKEGKRERMKGRAGQRHVDDVRNDGNGKRKGNEAFGE